MARSKEKDPRDAEIERLKKQLEESREKNSHYGSERACELLAFKLYVTGSLDGRDLGRLVSAFNERFHYGLFVQYYMRNDARGQYRLYAIERYTDVCAWDVEGKKKISKDDETAMNNFVRGFIAATENAT